jgi:hypothetical protein
LVLNRPVITALKGRYAERWPRAFYSSLRPRYLSLRSVALIARRARSPGLFEIPRRAKCALSQLFAERNRDSLLPRLKVDIIFASPTRQLDAEGLTTISLRSIPS